MFELSVETQFAAAHALVINGEREPVHGHNWHVTATLQGEALDADGLLVDFHIVESALAEVTGPFRNADLNRTPPFDRVNPSAENVARHIAESVHERVRASRANEAGVRVESVRVTEAPGCAATYRLPGDAGAGGSRR